MSDAPIYCAACGTQNARVAPFCTACGTALVLPPNPEHPAKTVAREVAKTTGEQLRDEAIKQASSFLVAKLVALWTTVITLAQSFLFWMTSSTFSFVQWFVLTWPLTLAATLITLTHRRVEKGMGIIPVGTVIIVLAGWLGTTISGVRYYHEPRDYFDRPTNIISGAINQLEIMLAIYGPTAFAVSVVTGIAIGLIIDRMVPEGITQVS